MISTACWPATVSNSAFTKTAPSRSSFSPSIRSPRIIGKEEFSYLERGLKQRVTALNLFLKDVYGKKQIISDGVVPADFVYTASGYLAPCEGIVPPKEIFSHVSGIDLVQGKDGVWYILEDNLRVPSGASYPTIVRGLERRCSPHTFHDTPIEDNRNYPQLLRHVMDYVNTGGMNVVLTPGRYNAAYFEHSYLAEQMGVPLVTCNDLEVEGDTLFFTGYAGRKERVGAVYRRISDEYMDPMTFNPESLIGIPHIFDVYRKGRSPGASSRRRSSTSATFRYCTKGDRWSARPICAPLS